MNRSNGVGKTSSEEEDDEDDADADASNYLQEKSVTKNGSKPSDVNIGIDIVQEGANNDINLNEDCEVMILSPPPPPPPSSSATDFLSLKVNITKTKFF